MLALQLSSRKVLLLCLLLVLQLQLGGARSIGSCKAEELLSSCKSKGQRWQHDAVCTYGGKCVVVDERQFSFMVTARLRQVKQGKAIKSLWMRGAGPGMSWDKPVELRRSGSSVDSWKTEIKYRSSSDALLCTSADYCFANQKALEFRLYRDQMGKEDMLGPNFFIELPLSGSMEGANNFLAPSVTVYPWFDSDKVLTRRVQIQSSLHVTGFPKTFKTQLTIIYPPSFEYNTRKMYPLVLYLGYAVGLFGPLLEHAFVHEASIQEAIVVGIDPMQSFSPFSRLCPYRDSYLLSCKEKNCIHNCMTCWNIRTEKNVCDKDEFLSQAQACLTHLGTAPRGEEVLDFIQMDIVPKLRELSQERLLVEFPKHRISIMGSLYGSSLLACHAALTRPHVYQNAACFSAPFYWPLSSSFTNPAPNPGIFQTFRDLEKEFDRTPALRSAYVSQKYYIDVASNENSLLPIIDVYKHTEDFIQQLEETLQLEKGKNILYFTVPDLARSYMLDKYGTPYVFNRILPAFKFFLKTEGGPSREAARLQSVSDKTIAEQNKLYGHLIGGSEQNESSAAHDGESCDARYTGPGGLSRPTEVPIIFFLPALGQCFKPAVKLNIWSQLH